MIKILVVGGTLLAMTWAGLRVWSAWTLNQANREAASKSQQSIEQLTTSLQKLPVHRLTFLGARLLQNGDHLFAAKVLGIATEKDRFYSDAFRYYSYALQAIGNTAQAEVADRRAKSLNPSSP